MKQMPPGYPILSCREAAELEASVLEGESAEWSAMQQAGAGIAQGLCRNYRELAPLPKAFNLLALIGKGNNGGDALIACRQLLDDFPGSRATLLFAVEPDQLRPLAQRAYAAIRGRADDYRLTATTDETAIRTILDQKAGDRGFDVCIDGLLGMSFRPPVRPPMSTLIAAVNAFDRIGLRAAVDLPSGKGDASDELFFHADFTYATGIPKQPLFRETVDCGRIRVVDLGFQKTPAGIALNAKDRVLASDVLQPLRALRPAAANKYTYGHVFIVGGSAGMPGALLMSVQASVRSGVGLVTAFAPASVAASLAAQVPEAMWIPWPETADGMLDTAHLPLLLERIDRATAVVIGPGMARGAPVETLAREIVEQVEHPIVVDADALQKTVIQAAAGRKDGAGSVILTPHVGEFMRVAGLEKKAVSNETLRAFCQTCRVTTVLKGPFTRICDGDEVLYTVYGSPVLSRGGSGDLLAGLMGGMIAQKRLDVSTALSCATVLHGLAAERFARERGQICVRTTQLLDYLPAVLRKG